MASHLDIADALERARTVATDGIIPPRALNRRDREFLQTAGWLRRIIRGWYLLQQPTDGPGNTTAWYGSYWRFLELYLERRLGTGYCLSAESSFDLHVGVTQVPKQVIVIAARGGTSTLDLPEGKSLLTYEKPGDLPDHEHVDTSHGLRIMSLPLSLVRISPTVFEKQPESVEIALRQLHDPSDLIRIVVAGPHVRASERLVGALELLGQHDHAARIQEAMESAGHRLAPKNPFLVERPLLSGLTRLRSPYAGRVEALWRSMRPHVLQTFGVAPEPLDDVDRLIERIDATQAQDAYHSLSIEGYRVTPDLIARIRSGAWDPATARDGRDRDALAAKGYNVAFNLVRDAIRQSLLGSFTAQSVIGAVPTWYSALFSPSVTAGLLTASDLAGYRNGPVFIRGASHVPPPREAVVDAMETFERCFAEETSPVVRAVLGHFIFVWIHPFSDGNGRIARFIMNAALVPAGFPWTVIRVDNRAAYMSALEAASSAHAIVPFVRLIEAEALESRKTWRRA